MEATSIKVPSKKQSFHFPMPFQFPISLLFFSSLGLHLHPIFPISSQAPHPTIPQRSRGRRCCVWRAPCRPCSACPRPCVCCTTSGATSPSAARCNACTKPPGWRYVPWSGGWGLGGGWGGGGWACGVCFSGFLGIGGTKLEMLKAGSPLGTTQGRPEVGAGRSPLLGESNSSSCGPFGGVKMALGTTDFGPFVVRDPIVGLPNVDMYHLHIFSLIVFTRFFLIMLRFSWTWHTLTISQWNGRPWDGQPAWAKADGIHCIHLRIVAAWDWQHEGSAWYWPRPGGEKSFRCLG